MDLIILYFSLNISITILFLLRVVLLFLNIPKKNRHRVPTKDILSTVIRLLLFGQILAINSLIGTGKRL